MKFDMKDLGVSIEVHKMSKEHYTYPVCDCKGSGTIPGGKSGKDLTTHLESVIAELKKAQAG
jgi:hypothetical protein